MTPVFIGSEIYRHSSYGRAHPLRVPRVSTVMDLCRAMDWFAPGQYRTSPRARPAALTAWHTPEYIAALEQAEGMAEPTPEMHERHHLGTLSNPMFPEMYRRPATGAGGVMLAAELVRDGGVVHVPGGGTHHGMPDRANGFCYLNDCVLGMLTLRRLGIRRIAYVDIDAHHCDGVQTAFAGDPEALLISTHEEGRWPFTGLLADEGGGNCYNLPVPRGFGDAGMAMVLDRLILPRLAEFAPDAVILQCGADGVEEDPLSRLSMSNNAHWSVVAALRGIAPRYIVLGGGGYNPWTVGRLWSGIWAVLAGHEVPDRLPEDAAAILAGLDWGGGARPPPDPRLLVTLRDTPKPGIVDPALRERLEFLERRCAVFLP